MGEAPMPGSGQSVSALFQVVVGGEEFLEVVGVGRLDLDHPSFAVWVGIDQAGVLGEVGVDRGDGAGDAGVEVAGGLDRFDLAPASVGGDFVADLGERD